MQARARCFTSYEGTGEGPEALLPLETSNAEAKSSVEKGKWVGLGLEQMGEGSWLVGQGPVYNVLCSLAGCIAHGLQTYI